MNWRQVIDRGSRVGGLALWLVLTGFIGLGVVLVGVITGDPTRPDGLVVVLTWVARVLG